LAAVRVTVSDVFFSSRRRHTRFSRDWSSDVCSSDLLTSAFRVEPDVGIALDTTLAVDTPDIKDHQRITKLGGGVGIKVMDSSSISTRWLLDEFLALAEQGGIDHQLEVLPLGGTDAGAIQRSRLGVPSITLSMPSRYVHTVTEMVSKADLEAGVALLTAFLQEGTARLKS